MSETRKIRKGEEIEIGPLREFLERELGSAVNEVEIRQFPAGSSNLTYLVEFNGKEFVLRRPPFGNRVATAHDMSREFRVLTALSGVYAPAPKPLLFCDDPSVIGSDFYLMERRDGVVVRGDWPFKTEPDPKKVVAGFVRNLADLHAIDTGSEALGGLGKPDGYAERQVVGWSERYRKARTDEWPDIENVIGWLNERIPDDDGSSVVHNDYKFDNVVLDPENPARLVAVLDWEMATIGSPLMDLGTTLGYWMSPVSGDELMSMPFNPRVLMESVSREEIAELYAEFSGRDVSNISYYYVFGTFKIAVIAQQIYYRYAKGKTKDRRFAQFNRFVGALGRIAKKATAD